MQSVITIIGGGIIGSSIAYQLSKYKELSIIVIEQSTTDKPEKSSIGHSRITGRATGSECKEYIDLLPISNQIYKDFKNDNPTVFYPGDCITFSKSSCEKLIQIINQIKDYQIEADIIENCKNTIQADPFLRSINMNESVIIEKASSENMLGILDPTEATHIFQRKAKENGVIFYHDQKVTHILNNGKSVTLEVEQNQSKTTIHSDKVILATNANTTHYPKLNKIISRQRIPLIFISIDDFNFKNSYLELMPEGKYGLFVMPERIGNKLFLKAGIHHIEPYEDTSLSDEEFMIKMKPIIFKKVIENFPFVENAHISNSVMCEYANTPDGLPIVGNIENNIWIAAGFNGNGCKHAAAFGEILAEDIISNTSNPILRRFNPLRFF